MVPRDGVKYQVEEGGPKKDLKAFSTTNLDSGVTGGTRERCQSSSFIRLSVDISQAPAVFQQLSIQEVEACDPFPVRASVK